MVLTNAYGGVRNLFVNSARRNREQNEAFERGQGLRSYGCWLQVVQGIPEELRME